MYVRWRVVLANALRRAATSLSKEQEPQKDDYEFQPLADALPVLIGYVDREQRYRFINRAYEEWFGLPRDAIIGRTVHEIVGGAAYAQARVHVEAALAGEAVHYETFLPYERGGGRHVDATLVPRRAADGGVEGFYALIADATDRWRAKEAARASEERLELARAASGIGLWDWDVEHGELRWSDETFVIHGLQRGSIAPSYEKWFEVMHPEDRDRIASEMAARSFARQDPDYQYRTVWPDGSVHWVISKGRIFAEDGALGRLSGVVYDVTQIREGAEALRRANEMLEQKVADRTRQLEHEAEQRRQAEAAFLQAQKMEAVGKLTGGVAHDFNNLLTTIIGNLELIGRRADQSPHIRKLAQAAEHAASRAARLTESLLAFARVRPMRRETIDVNRLVEDFSGIVRRAVGDSVRNELDLSSDVHLIHTDPAQLEAALLNLAINARDAMPDGGVLRLCTRNVRLRPEDLADNKDATAGEFVEIEVRDSGTGMPDDILGRVFEPFFTTKEVGKGSGLGLSQVFGFARQSNGDVRIESEMGRGTVVRLYLPRAVEIERKADAAPLAAAPESAAATILVVEDDSGVRDVTAEILTDIGYRAVSARDGAEALAILRERRDIDLLFSDVVMPGSMSGVALGRAVREIQPGLPVLLTSGYAESALAAEDAEGEFDLLKKPYNRTQLGARLRSILDRRVEACPAD
jgi:PAS domain S-box-containing protein